MTDVLGYRAKFGVLGPSTNTIVQPDFDDLRVEGVTNRYSRTHVSGRTNRIRALRKLIECAKSLPDVRFPMHEELADWYPEIHEDHFPGQQD